MMIDPDGIMPALAILSIGSVGVLYFLLHACEKIGQR